MDIYPSEKTHRLEPENAPFWKRRNMYKPSNSFWGSKCQLFGVVESVFGSFSWSFLLNETEVAGKKCVTAIKPIFTIPPKTNMPMEKTQPFESDVSFLLKIRGFFHWFGGGITTPFSLRILLIWSSDRDLTQAKTTKKVCYVIVYLRVPHHSEGVFGQSSFPGDLF